MDLQKLLDGLHKVVGDPGDKRTSFVYFGISLVAAAIYLYLTQGFVFDTSSPEVFSGQLVTTALAVLGLGTFVYNLLRGKPKQVEPEGEVTTQVE